MHSHVSPPHVSPPHVSALTSPAVEPSHGKGADAAHEPALFRCVHDDGDEEDLEEDEAAEAIEAFDLAAMAHEEWFESGHAFIGKRVGNGPPADRTAGPPHVWGAATWPFGRRPTSF